MNDTKLDTGRIAWAKAAKRYTIEICKGCTLSVWAATEKEAAQKFAECGAFGMNRRTRK